MAGWISGLHRRRTALLLGLIVLLGAGLRFWQIGAKTVWLDEAFSIWIAKQGLWSLWGWLIKIDQHPPLYYTLLSLWQALLGDEQGVVRAFSALCGTLTIPFFFATTRRISRDRVTALLAALFLAVAPFHVRFAQEARMYALLTLAAAGAFHFAARYLDGSGTRRLTGRDFLYPRRWIRLGDVGAAVGLAVFQAAAMLTHNTAAVFFTAALNIPVLGLYLYRRQTGHYVDIRAVNARRFLPNWLRIQGAALLLWSVWLIPFVIQAVRVDREFWIGAPTWATVTGALRTFSFAHLPDSQWVSTWLLGYLGLALLGAFFLRRRSGWLLLILSLLLLPFLGELLVSLRRPIFYDRTLIWTTLPYYLLLAGGVRGLVAGTFGNAYANPLPMRTTVRAQRGLWLLRCALAVAAVLAVVTLSSFALATYYRHFQKEDWAPAAAYVAEAVEPDDIILFNATWVQIPFEYYFRTYNLPVELYGAPVDLFDLGVLEPKMTEADVDYLRTRLASEGRVWLVYSHDWYADPEQIVLRTLYRDRDLVSQQRFVGLRVLLFAR